MAMQKSADPLYRTLNHRRGSDKQQHKGCNTVINQYTIDASNIFNKTGTFFALYKSNIYDDIKIDRGRSL